MWRLAAVCWTRQSVLMWCNCLSVSFFGQENDTLAVLARRDIIHRAPRVPDFRHFALQIGTDQYCSKHAFFLKAPTPPPKLEYSKLNLNIAYKFLHYCYNLLYAAWHAVRAVCSILCINDTLSHVRVFCVCIVHNTYDIVTAFMQLNALNLLFLGKRYKNFQRLGASLPGPRHSPPVATFWPPTFSGYFSIFGWEPWYKRSCLWSYRVINHQISL